MSRHPAFRALGVLKWSGAAACVAVLLMSAVSVFVGLGYGHRAFEALVMEGIVDVERGPFRLNANWGFQTIEFMIIRSDSSLWAPIVEYFALPSFRPGGIHLPLGVPLLLTAVATAILFRRDHRASSPAGHCLTCGYNLTGNKSGFCSECGTKIEADQRIGSSRLSDSPANGGD